MFDMNLPPSNLGPSYRVAVSGGVDSMAMLDFYVKGRHKPKVAFFHHGTAASDAGMEVVCSYCAKNGLDLKVGFISDPNIPDGRSAEDYWREQRYKFFNYLESNIVLAHHLDDAIETYLMGLLNGQPTFMPNRRVLESGYHLFRPFLYTAKKEFISWCVNKGVEWAEDYSNLDVRYKRSYVRQEIVPKMFEAQPGFHKTFARMIKQHNST